MSWLIAGHQFILCSSVRVKSDMEYLSDENGHSSSMVHSLLLVNRDGLVWCLWSGRQLGRNRCEMRTVLQKPTQSVHELSLSAYPELPYPVPPTAAMVWAETVSISSCTGEVTVLDMSSNQIETLLTVRISLLSLGSRSGYRASVFHASRFALPLKWDFKSKTWEEVRIRGVTLDEGFDTLWKYRKYWSLKTLLVRWTMCPFGEFSNHN